MKRLACLALAMGLMVGCESATDKPAAGPASTPGPDPAAMMKQGMETMKKEGETAAAEVKKEGEAAVEAVKKEGEAVGAEVKKEVEAVKEAATGTKP